MSRKIIFTSTASPPIGAFNQAIVANKTVYVSGCIGYLESGDLVPGGIKERIEAALNCLKNILIASGSKLENVLKANIFLEDYNNYGIFNEMFQNTFAPNIPARTCIGVGTGGLSLGAPIEIEAIASIGENTKKVISTDAAPKPISAYSQAIVDDKIVYVSGCVGQLETGKLVSGGIKEQTQTALNNLKNILLASGSSLNNVLKVNVYLQDFDEYEDFEEVYSNAFASDCPVRSCVEVSKLPLGALVEIDAIAFIGEKASKKIITTTTAPPSVGAYSQAVVFDQIVYISGQIGEFKSDKLVGGMKEQSKAVIDSLKNILIASGSNTNNVLKATIYVKDINDYNILLPLYENAFGPDFPACTLIKAKNCQGALVEIDIIALVEK